MLIDIPQLRGKGRVFRDRFDAGEKLAEILSDYKDSSAVILALPAGGVPVAAVIAEKLGLSLDVAVVSKITLPWNSETGFGAVAFDGTVCLNEQMLAGLTLSSEQVQQRIKITAEKVALRLKKFRGDRQLPDLSGKTVFLVDDGIASGFTMLTALKATAKLGAQRIEIAVPTGHSTSLTELSKIATTIYCANVRSGHSFAVADAYKKWSDVSEDEAEEILRRFNRV
jgi:predicted phosphoribosyltransferase